MKRMREENGGAAAGDIASLSQYMQSKDDAPKLRCQLNPLLSLAKEIFKQGGCTEQEAIKKAWRLRKTRGVPMDDVTKPLMRYLSWCITTSDIERDFALERRLVHHKSSCRNGTRFKIMRLASGDPSTLTLDDFKWVVGRAQELWVQQHPTGTRQLRDLDARKGKNENMFPHTSSSQRQCGSDDAQWPSTRV